MKRAIFILGVVLAYACTKTDAPAVTPAPPVVQEESVKFSTNLDTGTLNFTDTIPLVITVNSKVPAAGFQYTVTTTWTDSSKQIFKIDTAVNANTLSFNLPGHTRMGNYSIAVSVTSKSTSSNTSSKTISAVNIPYLPAVNIDMFPNLNWNDHVAYKSAPYDINKDGIPDIVSYDFGNSQNKSVAPAVFSVRDYSGKTIFNFDIKSIKPDVRDSLSTVLVDYEDINKDGFLDFGLSYMAEWWTGQPGTIGSSAKYVGNFVYLLLSKGNLQYNPIKILDEPEKERINFGIKLFDWDFDGQKDILLEDLTDNGDFWKNTGNNIFQRGTLPSEKIKLGIWNKLDFNNDGQPDYLNLYVNQYDEYNKPTSSDFSQVLSVLSSKGISKFPVIGKTIKKYIYVTSDYSAERINMVDGDGDGDLDLIVGYINNENGSNSYQQEYFENTGSQFEFRQNYIENDKTLYGELQVWSTDIDKDGLKDLFYPTYSKSRIGGPRSTPFWWKNTKQGFKIMKSYRFKY